VSGLQDVVAYSELVGSFARKLKSKSMCGEAVLRWGPPQLFMGLVPNNHACSACHVIFVVSIALFHHKINQRRVEGVLNLNGVSKSKIVQDLQYKCIPV
jgi:hypothetical protein